MLDNVRPCGCRGPAGASSCRSGRLPAAPAPPRPFPPGERTCSSVRGNGVSPGDTYTGSKNHRRRSLRGAGTTDHRLDRAGHPGRRRAGAGLGLLGGHRGPPGRAEAHHLGHQPRPAGGLRRRRRGGTPVRLRRIGPDRHRCHHLRPAAARRLDGRRRPGPGGAARPRPAHHVRRARRGDRPHRRRGGRPPSRTGGRRAPRRSRTRRRGGGLPAPRLPGGGLHAAGRSGSPSSIRPSSTPRGSSAGSP